MLALITGATSGIGKESAIILLEKGWNVIAVGRNKSALSDLKRQYGEKVTTVVCDLADTKQCFKLYETFKNSSVDMLVNNAGFGAFGKFWEVPLEKELDMINVNLKSLHILMKLFLKDFVARDSGIILNVASSAGFLAGPLMATYYATKNYVVSLSVAVNEELRRNKSKVRISVLCPGPVDTNFNNTAGVQFSVKPLSARKVAEEGIKGALEKKSIIIPGYEMKAGVAFSQLIPKNISAAITYNIQKSKLH